MKMRIEAAVPDNTPNNQSDISMILCLCPFLSSQSSMSDSVTLVLVVGRLSCCFFYCHIQNITRLMSLTSRDFRDIISGNTGACETGEMLENRRFLTKNAKRESQMTCCNGGYYK